MLHGDTKIKLLSGKIKTVEEMFNSDERFFVYSIDSNFNIFPAEIQSINKSYVHDTMEVTLDNSDKIETSLTHMFLSRNLENYPADLLKLKTSLLPMHFKINKESYNYNREMFYDFNTNTYLFTHHVVMSYTEPRSEAGGFDIHHIDENYLNNNPNNLMWLDSNKHKTFHEQERKCKYNAERDKNYNNDLKRNSILASGACLIRKYALIGKDLIDSRHAAGFLRYPITTFLIDKYFESFDEFLNLAYEREKTLSKQDYERLTRSADDRKAAKKDKMAKIGRYLLDEGKAITKENYEEKNMKLHLKAPAFEKIDKYFKTFSNYMQYVSNYNHKVYAISQKHYNEKIPVYYIKLKKADNFCVALNNGYLMIHV